MILSNKLFALDIGTRSVVGIILTEMDDCFHVEDLLIIEHKERSMIDGQIHNIVSVAKVITDIKEQLEERHGKLERVSVAAAGRALKTENGSMAIDISNQALFSIEDINRLELAAVQQAQQKLLSVASTTDDYYYCVGYSVLHYELDGERIGSLIDQSGRTASAHVIATFLPRVVVESLLSALKRADLEMEALTLEPIAAINVLIPPSMRRLNVALVDIGAGTSDIALTDNNTVVAYGMVPIAGDEITEALSNEYLLDFPVAELAKRALTTEEFVTFNDILGLEQQIAVSEVISKIKPSIEKLADSIGTEIKKLNNGKPPQAIMLVGGGSLTPQLTKELSMHLDLPENRVGIRGLDALASVSLGEAIPSSPALVTPIGIAIAAKRAPIHYMTVIVNERTIRLFELKEMTIGDALLAANIKAKQLYGKPGLGISITVNGNRLIIPGEHGKPSVILQNGQPASTKDPISNGDVLSLQLGKDGEDASVTLEKIIGDLSSLEVQLNGRLHTITPHVLVNGEQASLSQQIHDSDEIIYHPLTTVKDFLSQQEEVLYEPFEVSINDQKVVVDDYTPKIFIGEQQIGGNYKLNHGDCIHTVCPQPPTVNDLLQTIGEKHQSITKVTFNGDPVTIIHTNASILVNGQKVSLATKICRHDELTITQLPHHAPVFSDVFKFIEYTLPSSASSYQLLCNGQMIGFNDTITDGDELAIVYSP